MFALLALLAIDPHEERHVRCNAMPSGAAAALLGLARCGLQRGCQDHFAPIVEAHSDRQIAEADLHRQEARRMHAYPRRSRQRARVAQALSR